MLFLPQLQRLPLLPAAHAFTVPTATLRLDFAITTPLVPYHLHYQGQPEHHHLPEMQMYTSECSASAIGSNIGLFVIPVAPDTGYNG